MKKLIFKKTHFLLIFLVSLIFITVGYAVFDKEKNQALALNMANYGKLPGQQLTAADWNRLATDFVAKNTSGTDGTITGDLTITGGNLILNNSLCFGADCRNAWPVQSSVFWSGVNSGNINTTNTGNVGIGTSNPSQKLDVNGTIKGDVFYLRKLNNDPSALIEGMMWLR